MTDRQNYIGFTYKSPITYLYLFTVHIFRPFTVPDKDCKLNITGHQGNKFLKCESRHLHKFESKKKNKNKIDNFLKRRLMFENT